MATYFSFFILQKMALIKKKRMSPYDMAKLYCQAGIDQDGFAVKLVNDHIGEKNIRLSSPFKALFNIFEVET